MSAASEGGFTMQSRVLFLVVSVLSLLLSRLAGAQGSARSISVQGQEVSFEPAVDYSAGDSPVSVAVGDFNGDGAPDLVLANQGSGNVSVLLGNSDGTFQAAQDFEVFEAHNTFCVAVADFYDHGI